MIKSRRRGRREGPLDPPAAGARRRDPEEGVGDPRRGERRGPEPLQQASEALRGLGLGLAKLANFANFWRARSRLYQNEI